MKKNLFLIGLLAVLLLLSSCSTKDTDATNTDITPSVPESSISEGADKTDDVTASPTDGGNFTTEPAETEYVKETATPQETVTSEPDETPKPTEQPFLCRRRSRKPSILFRTKFHI